MGYKLVALDMDGTLLNSKGEISKRTLEAIHKAQDKGVLVTACTGRPLQGVDKYNGLLEIDGPVIIYNGAMIVHTRTREILFEEKLNTEDARRILELGKKYNTTMCVWSQNKLYGNVLNDRINEYKKLSDVVPHLIEDYEELLAQGITKILWNDEVERVNHFLEVLEKEAFQAVSFCTSKPIFLELFSSKVSKAVAMETIGKLYHIDQSEMIAIGDGKNDLSMIKYAGLGVAMGNAPDEVKEEADVVTSSNDCDGIAEIIESYILK